MLIIIMIILKRRGTNTNTSTNSNTDINTNTNTNRFTFNNNDEEIKILKNGVSKKQLTDFSSSLFSLETRRLLVIQSSSSSSLVPFKDKKLKYIMTQPIDLHKKKDTDYFPNLV